MIFTDRGITGFDISTWQDSPAISGNVDFCKMRDYGAQFVIVKAGQGDWIDPDFLTSWHNSKGILPRASYWYYDNRYDPKAQARKYYDIIKFDMEGICWLDLEDKTAGTFAGWRKWFDFLEEFKLLSGLPYESIGIYTGYYFWIERMTTASQTQIDYFARFPLWLAWYQANPFKPDYAVTKCPPPWYSPLILQSGTPAIGLEVGVESTEIDYNIFNGDAARFEKYFGTIPTQEPEQPMSQWYRVKVTLNIRSGPGTSYSDIGDLQAGDKVETTAAPVGSWVQIAQIVRVSGEVVVPPVPSWCNAGPLYCEPVAAVPTLPDVLIINGVEYRKA